MSCPFAHDDGAYVLGALSPGERLEFEKHLATCDECGRSVRDLAGLPGLLDRVDARVLEHPAADPPLPATLLPALTREIGRGRRRRAYTMAGLAAAAATVAALSFPVVASLTDDDAPPTTPSAGSSSSPGSVETLPMVPRGDVPVEATLGLEQVAWGTRLLLTCSYEPSSVEYALPPEVDYLLFVRTRDGRTEQVGSWRSISGTTMQVPAATSVARDEIRSVEVRTTTGLVVLRLRA
ncbi:anti-sigma factor family protein [Nocardioides sp. P5_C9_2]